VHYHPGEGGVTVVTHRYSYTEFANGEKMLYDLQKDPDENINIADDPDQMMTVLQLSQMLKNGWKSVLP